MLLRHTLRSETRAWLKTPGIFLNMCVCVCSRLCQTQIFYLCDHFIGRVYSFHIASSFSPFENMPCSQCHGAASVSAAAPITTL